LYDLNYFLDEAGAVGRQLPRATDARLPGDDLSDQVRIARPTGPGQIARRSDGGGAGVAAEDADPVQLVAHRLQFHVAPIVLGDAEALRLFALHRPDVGQRHRFDDDVAVACGRPQQQPAPLERVRSRTMGGNAVVDGAWQG